MTTLSIGMATYDDYDGVYFTIQSLRLYHEICRSNNIEYIVLDTDPSSSHSDAIKHFLKSVPNSRYYTQHSDISSFNKYNIVNYASGDYILILDCHVLIATGGLDALLSYYSSNPNTKNLIQGPLLYDNLNDISTHFDPVWRGDMYGIWAKDRVNYDLNKPFEIPMQGMGLCSFKKENWPGIHPKFKGFGAEEGYIAEKFRRNGGQNICIPELKWVHRFGRPNGIKYPLILEDRIWNYFLGWMEMTKDPDHQIIRDIYEHFTNRVSVDTLDRLLRLATKTIFDTTP